MIALTGKALEGRTQTVTTARGEHACLPGTAPAATARPPSTQRREPPVFVVTELKLGFTLGLVLQGVDRLAAADEVWRATRQRNWD